MSPSSLLLTPLPLHLLLVRSVKNYQISSGKSERSCSTADGNPSEQYATDSPQALFKLKFLKTQTPALYLGFTCHESEVRSKTAFIKAENSEELFAVLRSITRLQGLPEKKNNTAAEGREVYIEYQRYFNNFLPFAKKNDDWEAPPEVAAAVPTWANLRGHSFTRDQITLSANLTTTATNNNNSLFRSVEALGEEVGAEGDELDSQRRKVLDRKYGSAAWGQFKAWVDRKLAELDSPVAGPSKSKKKKKKKSKAKGKSKARKEADSDDLDGSSGTD
ncbi:hypothetical protein C8F04DRAFT_1187276 [Mycena alexandri]|uniref:Uncharacterized protein n=1 Tax=Mycena alexandri TaxID=1745969 RepID=A0AAD6SLL8_9AGAR|nr:hypothetical protein C8F04DRAFT_1187276 [Mycena alexandri]